MGSSDELRCKNCGVPVKKVGSRWVHTGEPPVRAECTPIRVAEPACPECGGVGTKPKWSGCGCGRGVSHIVDCGTRPPRVTCERCSGTGVEPEAA